MDDHDHQYNEENAWSTVMTTLSPANPNMGDSHSEPNASTAQVAASQSIQSDKSSSLIPVTTPQHPRHDQAVPARSRGLTSTLSGRRHRLETQVQEAPQRNWSPLSSSTAPDNDGSGSRPHSAGTSSLANPGNTSPSFNVRRNSNLAGQNLVRPALHPSQQQAAHTQKEHISSHVLGQRGSGLHRYSEHENTGLDNGGNKGGGGLNDDEMDAPPPESLLVEVRPSKRRQNTQKHDEPTTVPVRRYASRSTRQQTIAWGSPPQQSPPSEANPTYTGANAARGGGAAGFVRRAAHAVHTRIHDIGGHAAEVSHLGSPMPPPRQHRTQEEDVYGDGRVFSASSAVPRRAGRQQRSRIASATPLSYRERALRAWRDSKHQDDFFCRVYSYFAGKGVLTIVLARVLQLVTLGFVVALSTFVFGCIDHAKVRKQRSLSEVVIPQCTQQFSWTVTILLYLFAVFWLAQMVRTVLEIPSLLEIRAFFTEVLGIPPADIGTVAWHEIVDRMVKLRDIEIREYRGLTKSRILGYRLTADAIVNRIMRRENYMIALFNKDVLNISIPGLGKDQVLTKALEWNLSFCLMSYLFDERGQLRHRFLKESNRDILAKGLRRRFQFMAAINMMFAPFIVVFLVLYSFLRYFDELYHEPGTLTSRAFTPYAKYKFRNFNEVPHSFHRRLSSAHPKATLYLGQFRNDALITVARFVSFVAGSFTALLLVLTVFDNELSLEFEITPHRTVLFYIGLFSAILAATRGMIPTEEQEYLHPAWIIRDALEDLQYMEPEWRGKLDTTKVRRDFEALFSYKLLIFAHELLGVITAPFVMLVSLPSCAERVIDFFREFTVHEGGLGYVCSFAVFDFERHGNVKFAAPARAPNEHLTSKHGKMEQSFLAFKADYPEWQPRDQAGSIYLQRAQNTQHELWRMGSATSGVGAGAGWQGRLLQQQRMAGSIYPTGASLYRPNHGGAGLGAGAPSQAAGSLLRPVPEEAPVNSTAAAAAAVTTRSQYAFQPPGFISPNSANLNQQQSLASQAMLPFGPTLGGFEPATATAAAVNDMRDKGKGRSVGDMSPVERLALSSLPLVASTEMGNSLEFSVNAGRFERQPSAGIFSIVNQLYEQHRP